MLKELEDLHAMPQLMQKRGALESLLVGLDWPHYRCYLLRCWRSWRTYTRWHG